jgi:hypothetical protein
MGGHMPQEPRGLPQPQEPEWTWPVEEGEEEVAPPPLTAKTLRARAVFAEPQAGHFTGAVEDMLRARCSKGLLQALHLYS